jgi:hypothetical protein
MVNLRDRVIKLKDSVFHIDRFEVWFAVPGRGLCTTLEEALDVSSNDNIDARDIRPMSVAVSDIDGVYEII